MNLGGYILEIEYESIVDKIIGSHNKKKRKVPVYIPPSLQSEYVMKHENFAEFRESHKLSHGKGKRKRKKK